MSAGVTRAGATMWMTLSRAMAAVRTPWCRSCARRRSRGLGPPRDSGPHRPGAGPDAGPRRGRLGLLPLPAPPPGRQLPRAVQRQHHRPHARRAGADGAAVPASRSEAGRGRPRRPGQRGSDLLHRPVRPGPGGADQPSARAHAAGRRTRRGDGRADPRPGAGAAMAGGLVRGAWTTCAAPTCCWATASNPGRRSRAAFERGGDGVVDELGRSALRGRGGAGFATGRKWALCRRASGTPATSSATPTRASPAPSRTGCCSPAMPTWSSRA